MIDVTNLTLTERVLEAVVASKAGEDVDVDAFTAKERHAVAELMGWERTPYLAAWIADAPAPAPAPAGPDYEAMILARDEDPKA